MRSNVEQFTLKTPSSLNEALKLLADPSKNFSAFAGGTDLMVLYEAGMLKKTSFINLWGIQELRGIQVEPDAITLGALTTYTELRNHPVIEEEFPNLASAARLTGAISIQNRGTLGGNIANASPAADSPPALLTYGAEVELLSQNGPRWLDYSDFHTQYKTTQLGPGEIISRIRLKRARDLNFHYYRKVGTRKAQAISKICLAASAKIEGGVFQKILIGMGSVAPTPIRCKKTEEFLVGKTVRPELVKPAMKTILEDIHPIDDIRSTEQYRNRVTQNLVREMIESLLFDVELDQSS